MTMNTKCVNKQPNASKCFVCGTDNEKGLGLRFYDDGKASVETRFTLSDDFQGYPGAVSYTHLTLPTIYSV